MKSYFRWLAARAVGAAKVVRPRHAAPFAWEPASTWPHDEEKSLELPDAAADAERDDTASPESAKEPAPPREDTLAERVRPSVRTENVASASATDRRQDIPARPAMREPDAALDARRSQPSRRGVSADTIAHIAASASRSVRSSEVIATRAPTLRPDDGDEVPSDRLRSLLGTRPDRQREGILTPVAPRAAADGDAKDRPPSFAISATPDTPEHASARARRPAVSVASEKERPVIRISIGRVEVRAAAAAAPPAPRVERSDPTLSLDEYLRRSRPTL
jgi:hypothetical protein